MTLQADMSEKQEEKVYDLSFFMPGQTVEAEEIKVPISKRFVDKKGNVIPFVFKPITTERIDELEKENTTYKNIKGRGASAFNVFISRIFFFKLVNALGCNRLKHKRNDIALFIDEPLWDRHFDFLGFNGLSRHKKG